MAGTPAGTRAGAADAGRWRKVLGIVGGLGPHAHIRFEELLLRGAEARVRGAALRDQDYPPYLVSSLPGTPDRTEYVLGRGRSPLPWLERSLRALCCGGGAGGLGADFAVIACNAAHALLPELRALEIMPILSLVDEAVTRVRSRGAVRRVGVLATTGTLEAGIYQSACASHGIGVIGLPDLAGGAELQESLVMASVYGSAAGAGIKAGAHREPAHRRRLSENLERAVEILAKAGAEVVLTACTEIPLALPPGSTLGIEVIDPLEVAAQSALAVAAGEREV